MSTARLIVTGRNSTLPLDIAQMAGGSIAPQRKLVVCPDCGGSGMEIDFYICPIEHITKRRRIACATCSGQGAYEKVKHES